MEATLTLTVIALVAGLAVVTWSGQRKSSLDMAAREAIARVASAMSKAVDGGVGISDDVALLHSLDPDLRLVPADTPITAPGAVSVAVDVGIDPAVHIAALGGGSAPATCMRVDAPLSVVTSGQKLNAAKVSGAAASGTCLAAHTQLSDLAAPADPHLPAVPTGAGIGAMLALGSSYPSYANSPGVALDPTGRAWWFSAGSLYTAPASALSATDPVKVTITAAIAATTPCTPSGSARWLSGPGWDGTTTDGWLATVASDGRSMCLVELVGGTSASAPTARAYPRLTPAGAPAVGAVLLSVSASGATALGPGSVYLLTGIPQSGSSCADQVWLREVRKITVAVPTSRVNSPSAAPALTSALVLAYQGRGAGATPCFVGSTAADSGGGLLVADSYVVAGSTSQARLWMASTDSNPSLPAIIRGNAAGVPSITSAAFVGENHAVVLTGDGRLMSVDALARTAAVTTLTPPPAAVLLPVGPFAAVAGFNSAASWLLGVGGE